VKREGGGARPAQLRGRPRKLGLRDRRRLVRHIRQSRGCGGTTAERAARILGLEVSRRTVAREIARAGYRSMVRREKTVLTAEARAGRLAFARSVLTRCVAWFRSQVDYVMDVKTFEHAAQPEYHTRTTVRRVYRAAGESAFHHDMLRRGRRETTGSRGIKYLAGFCTAVGGRLGLALRIDGKWNSATFVAMIPAILAAPAFAPRHRKKRGDTTGQPAATCEKKRTKRSAGRQQGRTATARPPDAGRLPSLPSLR